MTWRAQQSRTPQWSVEHRTRLRLVTCTKPSQLQFRPAFRNSAHEAVGTRNREREPDKGGRASAPGLEGFWAFSPTAHAQDRNVTHASVACLSLEFMVWSFSRHLSRSSIGVARRAPPNLHLARSARACSRSERRIVLSPGSRRRPSSKCRALFNGCGAPSGRSCPSPRGVPHQLLKKMAKVKAPTFDGKGGSFEANSKPSWL